MPPTAFGNLPPPTVPVVILGPLAFPLGIFAPCAFWLFGSALFGSFFVVLGPLGCFWVPLALPGRFCPLCLVVLLALPFLAFFVALAFLGLSLGPFGPPLGVFVPLCLLAVFSLPSLGLFVVLGPFGLSRGHLCPLCLVALVVPPSWVLVVFLCCHWVLFWAPWLCALLSLVPFGSAFLGSLPFRFVALWPPAFLCL